MTPTLILIHSPSVGPGTWRPVARHLDALGVWSAVPDLRAIGAGGPPYWPRVAGTVAAAIAGLDDGQDDGQDDRPLVLVAHSNAGLFLPAVQQATDRAVAAAVFVDAGLPAEQGETAVAPAKFLSTLRTLADADGFLPRWTDWWSAEEVAQLLPDPAMRAAVVAEQPRLPLAYYQQSLPVPAPWASVPGAYLQFSDGYDGPAEQARAAGWPVARLRGEHLHQVVEPALVAESIVGLLARLNLGISG
jgi:hypothetical protein